MKTIGEYICGDFVFEIYTDTITIFIKNQFSEIFVVDKKDLCYLLTNPWEEIEYFEEENKYWYCSHVYDGVIVYIFGNTIKDLMNNLCFCFKKEVV